MKICSWKRVAWFLCEEYSEMDVDHEAEVE